MLLSYEDRSRIVPKNLQKRIFSVNGLIRATLLVDGFPCGIWKIERQKNSATLVIVLFGPLAQQDIQAVIEEGSLLLKFAAAELSIHNIQWVHDY